MSQLDLAIYTPVWYWVSVCVMFSYFALATVLLPRVYESIRSRDLFGRELGSDVLIGVGLSYIMKAIFMFKLFTNRANIYYIHLSKKLRQ